MRHCISIALADVSTECTRLHLSMEKNPPPPHPATVQLTPLPILISAAVSQNRPDNSTRTIITLSLAWISAPFLISTSMIWMLPQPAAIRRGGVPCCDKDTLWRRLIIQLLSVFAICVLSSPLLSHFSYFLLFFLQYILYNHCIINI